MELLIILPGLWVLAATVRSVLSDGRGHTPHVHSHAPWNAGDLPSSPYSSL
ncbi:hypothetical protein [Arthrobacter sp. 92]|jgi:hypothetical protein|uniref:hypothetical protein n=1 Tax=Arthrobacter sp. 92 TaxID=3418175 RepID=UPI0006A8A4E2|nr:hypothetical protein AHiyo6_35090 [Arthrobacter sp. Hiyo6]